MSKILLFSDLHIHAHKGSQERLEDCLKVLDWVIQEAHDRDIQNVIFGGDLFQERQRIQVYAYHQAWLRFKAALPDVRFYLLLGNHDLWYFDKTDISSIFPLGSLPHVQVIGQPSTMTIAGLDVDFLPFTHDPAAAIAGCFSNPSPILIGHVAVDGAVWNFHAKTKAEVSVEFENDMMTVDSGVFSSWRRVFLGHYHGAQKLTDNVEYMGSPLQLNFGEAFQDKHILILDTDDLSVEYIRNNFSPKHLILKPEEVERHNLAGNFVRIYLEDLSKTDVVEMKASALQKYPDAKITFHVEEKRSEDSGDKNKKFNLTGGDVLERYVEAIGPAGLNRIQLLTLGKEICLEN